MTEWRQKAPGRNMADVAEMQKALDFLVAQGIAYRGEDGRYRLKKGVEVISVEDIDDEEA